MGGVGEGVLNFGEACVMMSAVVRATHADVIVVLSTRITCGDLTWYRFWLWFQLWVWSWFQELVLVVGCWSLCGKWSAFFPSFLKNVSSYSSHSQLGFLILDLKVAITQLSATPLVE